jgi:phage-related protein (TIGR01555 family)
MVRRWYEVDTSIDQDYLDDIRRLERKTNLRKKILDGLCWGRLYGGAVGLILIKGQEDLSKPLDLDMVMPGSFLGIHILDRWSGVFPETQLVTDPEDSDFGLPAYYTVRNANDTYEIHVHHSRVVRFTGRDLPWLEQVAELYWGESEIEAIYNEIVRRDNAAANIGSLLFRANVEYREVEGLDQLLGIGNAEMQRRFWNQMQAMSMVRSSQGIALMNKGDQVHTEQYAFTGIPDVYDRIMMDVAGAARTPVTKLFGRSPAGMNSTGESDMINYYDYIDGLRETSLRQVLEKILPIMAMSAWGKIPDDMEVVFPSMQTPKEKDIAETAEKYTGAIVEAYQNDLIDRETATKELMQIDGLFDKVTDELAEEGRGITYSQSKMMNDPMIGMV